ncbi:Wzz/FepE/Etk N-terminal domain-containing protein [Bacillus sp. B15-48]|uniref:YveK family protein n=1 Tax=Bacillus sp. B15-48 TaxID=1548601 RepID=UPI00193EE8D7|nr:Wzz/FepE/Etk N-terminal domain-containing protein [Bacillus sp. B15-48]MBM4764476.1 hypothetical protein [Bacillus sp. B15-48]
MEQTISIRQFWRILKEHILLITFLGVIFAGVSWAIATYVLTPAYEASRKIVVNNITPNEVVDFNTVMTNFQFANTYKDIIYSDVVIEQVINDLKLNKTYKELSKNIVVNTQNESQVITIIVKDANYELAVDIVNKVATVFEKQVLEIIKIDNVQLFPPTKVKANPEPIYPKPILFMVIGLLAGLVIAFTISLFLEVFRNTIIYEEDIEELLNIPVIGVVSHVQSKDTNNKTPNVKEKVVFSQNKGLGG